jgi:hypothetical protein
MQIKDSKMNAVYLGDASLVWKRLLSESKRKNTEALLNIQNM